MSASWAFVVAGVAALAPLLAAGLTLLLSAAATRWQERRPTTTAADAAGLDEHLPRPVADHHHPTPSSRSTP